MSQILRQLLYAKYAKNSYCMYRQSAEAPKNCTGEQAFGAFGLLGQVAVAVPGGKAVAVGTAKAKALREDAKEARSRKELLLHDRQSAEAPRNFMGGQAFGDSALWRSCASLLRFWDKVPLLFFAPSR